MPAGRLLLLLIENIRERGSGPAHAKGLDLNLTLRREPAAAALAGPGIWHLLGGQPDLRAGRLVFHHPPADLILLLLRQIGQEHAFGRRQRPGVLELVILLERLQGRDRLVVELAGDEPVVKAGPGEIELDRGPLGERKAGIEIATGGCRSALLLRLALGLGSGRALWFGGGGMRGAARGRRGRCLCQGQDRPRRYRQHQHEIRETHVSPQWLGRNRAKPIRSAAPCKIPPAFMRRKRGDASMKVI
jgi:hypothetical protein